MGNPATEPDLPSALVSRAQYHAGTASASAAALRNSIAKVHRVAQQLITIYNPGRVVGPSLYPNAGVPYFLFMGRHKGEAGIGIVRRVQSVESFVCWLPDASVEHMTDSVVKIGPLLEAYDAACAAHHEKNKAAAEQAQQLVDAEETIRRALLPYQPTTEARA